MENDDIFDGLGVEITLKTKEDFLKVKETLTRIGISSRTDKKLWQSCHILHKRGKYYICHFKEMFVLDGLGSDISEEDIGRRNVIVKLLVEWGRESDQPRDGRGGTQGQFYQRTAGHG